jgi:hypothetical protein
MWLRLETSGGHLWMRQWTSEFREIKGILWLDEDMLAFQEGLYFVELVGVIICCDIKWYAFWKQSEVTIYESELQYEMSYVCLCIHLVLCWVLVLAQGRYQHSTADLTHHLNSHFLEV